MRSSQCIQRREGGLSAKLQVPYLGTHLLWMAFTRKIELSLLAIDSPTVRTLGSYGSSNKVLSDLKATSPSKRINHPPGSDFELLHLSQSTM
jgi:hypothetical protein